MVLGLGGLAVNAYAADSGLFGRIDNLNLGGGLFRVNLSAISNDQEPRPTVSGTLSGGGLTASGSSVIPGTVYSGVASLEIDCNNFPGEVTVTGTMTSDDGWSWSGDQSVCRRIPVPDRPQVEDDPAVQGDAHYVLPASTSDVYWSADRDGNVSAVVYRDSFADWTVVKWFPAPEDIYTPPVDTDGDGVPDKDDAFPNDPKESKDSDGDGVGDNADQCDNESGPASNNGCPVVVPPTDTDGDGTTPTNTPTPPSTPSGNSVTPAATSSTSTTTAGKPAAVAAYRGDGGVSMWLLGLSALGLAIALVVRRRVTQA